MDLNKAMVEMYKQRSSSNNSKKNGDYRANKHKSPASASGATAATNQSKAGSAGDELQVSAKKRLKYEDVLASFEYKPKGKFEDIHGCESVRDQVLNITARFKRAIEGQAKKSDWPVLICGSHGLGKTSIVEAAANQANLKLIPIPLKTLVEQTRNEFQVTLKQLVHFSLSIQPAIVLIDDLEQLNDKEDYRNLLRGAVRRLSIEDSKILIFCTTSSILDSSSGIDFLFTIQLRRPDCDARLKVMHSLRENNKNLVYLTDECLKSLATKMPSFTALDIRKMFDIAETESGGQPTLVHCEQAIEVVKQSFRRGTHLIGEKPSVTWNDIGGLTDVRRAFLDILKQIRRSDMNCKFAGIALYGPPGCGKTMVAQAMANEAGLNFISIKPAELVDKFLGETERNIRRVFSEAQEHEPCMIYFDEFDGLCGTRGNRDTVTSAIQTLLSEMDGFASRGKSIILASTNRLEDIDPAIKRPGRLSKHIFVGPPDVKARRDILSVVTSRPGISLAEDVDLDLWAERTDNFTGADLDFLVSEAESKATSELDDQAMDISEVYTQPVVVRQQHLEQSFDKIRLSNRELARKLNPAPTQ